MNFPTITRNNWMCCSIILVFLALGSPEPLQAQENQKERITIQVKNQPIQKVFDDLSKQTGLKFFYGEAIANRNVQVNLKFKNAPVNSVLNEITRQANLYFKRENNTIAVSLGNAGNASVPVTQDRKVTGIITDERGEPIIGANVVVKGTSNGTVTDLNGQYSIEANGKSILLISYIGYLSEEVAVGNNKTLNIQLKEDAQKLDEVVVIGYGTQKRSNLSGAISKVTSEVIESKPVTNVLSALQGEIPGMVIQRSSGQPGNEDFKMNIRGVSSANGDNAPLVLVDGIPGDINMINPQDIDAISVLKDASASIYGARAAGGVVLITTKKGATGAPKITYNGNLSISKMTGMMKAPTNYEMAIMDNEANIHNGSAPMYTQELLDRILSNDPNPIDHPLYGGWKLFFTNTDWMDELLNNGVQHKHNLTISGGGEKSNYYLSAGYSKQFGVVKYADDNNTKYNLRMNYDYRITDWLKLETKVALDNNKRTDVGSNGAWVIGEAILDMPNHPVYNADGNFFTQGGWSNAVALAKESETATFKTREMNGNFRLIANIIDGLTLTAQAGVNYKNKNNEDIAKAIPLYTWDNNITYYTGAGSPEQSAVDRTTEETVYQNYTAYLNYDKNFGPDHHLDAMLGMAYETEEVRMFMARRDNFISDELWELNLGGTGNMKNDAKAEHWATGSTFARLGYSFKNKYILETNFRYDGSSRFAPGNRWRMFPGVSASWRISQENFLKNSKVFNELKLRASYGQTGNQEGIRLYDYIQLLKFRDDGWGTKLIYPFGNGSQSQAMGLDVLAGVDRTWEILENVNVGVDAAFLDSRLGFSFDYFVKMNNNMLIPVTYPSMLGAEAPYSNSGKLRTNGFELTLNWTDKIGNVEYSAQFQLTDAVFWQKPSDFELAANDFYFSLMEASQYIDKNSDIAFGSGADDVSDGSYLAPVNSDDWDEPWKFIQSTSYLLKKAEESGLTDDEIGRWKAEAHFFRAYNYWKLVKFYGGVPKIEIPLNTSSEQLYTPRSSQQEIIDFIIDDLDKAIPLLPKQSQLTTEELGRTTQGAALALKARVSLYEGTWEKYHQGSNADMYIQSAIDAAQALVDSKEYALFRDKGKESYKYLHILEGDDSKEVLLARRYYKLRVTHNWTRELWFGAMVPTKNLADMYLCNDGLPIDKSPLFKGFQYQTSEFENRDSRMEQTFIVPGSEVFFEGGLWTPTYPGFVGNSATRTGYMIRKFLDETLDAAQFIGEYDFKEFRYAEVLLILAEALYEKNGQITDDQLDITINDLRNRANMPHLTNAFVSANGLNMLEEIRRERTVELAFEGYRRDDLRRWGTAETVLPLAIRGVKFVGTEYQQKFPELVIGQDIQVDSDGFIIAQPASARKFQTPKHWLSPIPLQQVQLSKGTLEQNPGW